MKPDILEIKRAIAESIRELEKSEANLSNALELHKSNLEFMQSTFKKFFCTSEIKEMEKNEAINFLKQNDGN